MAEILRQLPTALTCSQLAVRSDCYYVDRALDELTGDGHHIVLQIPQSEMCEGDYVFYTNRAGVPVHVARVNEEGKLISKFHKDPNVYAHDVWELIPENNRYERYTVIRSIPPEE